MVEIIGHNITCALGITSRDTYEAVASGQCGIHLHQASSLGVTEDFMASEVDTSALQSYGNQPMTRLELMAIHSVNDALSRCDIDVKSPGTLFILSSTKGNINLLDNVKSGCDIPRDRISLPAMATFIARHFGNLRQPVVVSNACISGLSALILAKRLLDTHACDTAVVIGADELTRFTVSGFQSFKALSPNLCRPFDKDRQGLNLGEAAATMILRHCEQPTNGQWYIESGSVHNDANHISGPSRVGEGSFRALAAVTAGIKSSDIAVINTHGTATLYNDEMESIAIDRAGLGSVNINAFKGYLGHTLGAAGILESILSMMSIDNQTLLPTMGFSSSGVSRPINVVSEKRHTDATIFIKLLSGFGGCNAAARFRKEVRS
ncbi:MAG: beta-ketoacyl synthase [Muribaculaceae bacterium]|nr:beta-ketoacyl synthase [Muribaculaceae bacterium]